MAGDHFMVGWGRVEALPPSLLFVDTGLAGAGVKLAESVISRAGIKLEEDKASVGAGGGGTLRIVPYVVHRVSFGQERKPTSPGFMTARSPGKPVSASSSLAWSATISSSRMQLPSTSNT